MKATLIIKLKTGEISKFDISKDPNKIGFKHFHIDKEDMPTIEDIDFSVS
jgi:hypothetical protein